MKREELEQIVQNIESSFIDGDLKVQLINYKKLLSYLDNDVLSLPVAEKMIKSSKKLKKMIKIIYENNKYNDLLENENFYTLMLAYLKINKLNTDIIEFDDFTPEVLSKKDENILNYFYNDLKYIITLTPEEEKEICIRATNGDEEARKILVETNIKLAVSIAKKHYNKNLNITFADLIQEGCLGLIKATEKYDYRKGYKFSTYATWWIMHKIKRCIIEKSRVIRIPVYLGSLYSKVLKYKNKVRKLYGFYPSDEAISEELNIPLHLIKRVNNISNPISLDSPINSEDGDDDLKMIDVIPYEKDEYEVIDERSVYEELHRYLKECDLNEKEQMVLVYKYGLYGVNEKNNTQIAAMMGISHERVRQLNLTALAKLSENNNIRVLRGLEPIEIVRTRKKRKACNNLNK